MLQREEMRQTHRQERMTTIRPEINSNGRVPETLVQSSAQNVPGLVIHLEEGTWESETKDHPLLCESEENPVT